MTVHALSRTRWQDVKVTSLGNVAYYAAFSLYVFIYCMKYTLFEDVLFVSVDSLYDAGRAMCALLLVAKLFTQRYTWVQIIGVAAASLAVGLSWYVSRDWNWVLLLLFVVAGKGISVKRLAIIALSVVVAITGITVLFSSDGYVDVRYVYRSSSGVLTQRSSLGFAHPNRFGQMVLVICCAFAVLRFPRFKLWDLVIYGSAMYACRAFADSKTAFVCIAVVAALSFVSGIVKSDRHKKAFLFVCMLIVVACVFLSYYLMVAFDPEISWMSALDSMLSSRLSLAQYYYEQYPPTMLGYPSGTLRYVSGDFVNPGPDNAFVRLLLQYGILPTVLFVAMYLAAMIGFWKRGHFSACVIGVTVYAFVAIMETTALSFALNFYLIGISWLLYGIPDSEEYGGVVRAPLIQARMDQLFEWIDSCMPRRKSFL